MFIVSSVTFWCLAESQPGMETLEKAGERMAILQEKFSKCRRVVAVKSGSKTVSDHKSTARAFYNSKYYFNKIYYKTFPKSDINRILTYTLTVY